MDQSTSNDLTNNKVILRKQDQKPIQKPKRFSKLWKSLIHKKSQHVPDSPPISETLPPKGNVFKNTLENNADFSVRNLPELYEVEQTQSFLETPQSIVKTTPKCHASTSDPVDLCNNFTQLQLSPSTTAEEEEDDEQRHIQNDRRHFFISDPSKMHEEEISEELLGFETSSPDQLSTTVHTQVDYVHYLVPDLQKIFNSSYYWGVMDRYEAEKLLENKPEGTFLLRDSAQEDFLFSVSFRRYNRSLHARIEQWCHKFSFDSHDSNVYSCPSVCGLIERYKDPSCLMFFEPMLTIPLAKRSPFSLQSLSRAAVCSAIKYDDISRLPVPRTLMRYLQYYHYKQRVRVRRF